MSTQIQRRRGTTGEHNSFTGAAGELTVDTNKNTVVVHDGSTAGGFPLAASAHTHSASAITGSGVIAISNGGTGANSAASALTALGAAASAHPHDSSDIQGFGSNIRFVDSQSAFASVYSGNASSKTVVMAPGAYTLPGTILPGVNLIGYAQPEDVVLSGGIGTWSTSATASGINTVFRNITIDGALSVSAGWAANLRLENVNTTILQLADASSLVEVDGGEIGRYDHSDGTFRTWDLKVTSNGSQNRGGTAVHKNLEIDVSSTGAALLIGTGVREETRVEFTDASLFAISGSATYWRVNTPAAEFYVWYGAGTAADPLASGTGIQVSASTVDSAVTIATNTASAMDANVNFSVVSASLGTIEIVNASVGSVEDALDSTSQPAGLISVSVLTQGINSSAGTVTIQGLEFKNPAGRGVEVTSSSVATIDGAIAGSIAVAGITVAGNAILNLGTHNLGVGGLVVNEQGTVVPLVAPLGAGQVVTSNIGTSQVVSSSIVGSAISQFQLSGYAKRVIHKTFIPIIGTVAGLDIPGGVSGSSATTAFNEIVIDPEFAIDGYIRQIRIESVSASTTPGSAMNFNLIRYGKRAVGTDIGSASQLTILDSQNLDSLGFFASRSAMGAAASAAGVAGGSSAGAGFPIQSAVDPEASVGQALVISVSTITGGSASALQGLMVTYVLQGPNS